MIENTKRLSIADIPDHVYEKNKKIAYQRFIAGDELTFSTGICESITAGFGFCDYYGYFEYPLLFDDEALDKYISENGYNGLKYTDFIIKPNIVE